VTLSFYHSIMYFLKYSGLSRTLSEILLNLLKLLRSIFEISLNSTTGSSQNKLVLVQIERSFYVVNRSRAKSTKESNNNEAYG